MCVNASTRDGITRGTTRLVAHWSDRFITPYRRRAGGFYWFGYLEATERSSRCSEVMSSLRLHRSYTITGSLANLDQRRASSSARCEDASRFGTLRIDDFTLIRPLQGAQ